MVSTRARSEQATEYRIFNRGDVISSGWYWLLPASAVKKGSVRPANIAGYELAVYRGSDGQVAALSAYCPHMGAHLAEGKVEGNQLRCFFHNWCFDREGSCTDIPCLRDKPRPPVSTRTWHVLERYGLIWIWLGDGEPADPLPEPPGLAGTDFDSSLGNRFVKNCHPNVVMVNAIDEQHFQTVHHLPGHILYLEDKTVSLNHISFTNTGTVPTGNLLGRLIRPLYRKSFTYTLDYWYGNIGATTFGPDFLHLHLMFALRMNAAGQTEGVTIAFAPRRRGLLGFLFNRALLFVTKLGGRYFAIGDTQIFQTIRFELKTPIAADRTVMAFIKHLEHQMPFARS